MVNNPSVLPVHSSHPVQSAWLKVRADLREDPIGLLENKLRCACPRLQLDAIARFGCTILHYFARFQRSKAFVHLCTTPRDAVRIPQAESGRRAE
jgi:hypothetical protein